MGWQPQLENVSATLMIEKLNLSELAGEHLGERRDHEQVRVKEWEFRNGVWAAPSPICRELRHALIRVF